MPSSQCRRLIWCGWGSRGLSGPDHAQEPGRRKLPGTGPAGDRRQRNPDTKTVPSLPSPTRPSQSSGPLIPLTNPQTEAPKVTRFTQKDLASLGRELRWLWVLGGCFCASPSHSFLTCLGVLGGLPPTPSSLLFLLSWVQSPHMGRTPRHSRSHSLPSSVLTHPEPVGLWE